MWELDEGTIPEGLEAKTSSANPDKVRIGDYLISYKDFFGAVVYVLTNSPIKPDDLRSEFLKCVRSMQPDQEGWLKPGTPTVFWH